MTEEELKKLGYTDIKTFPDGTQAGLMKLIFTHAIVYDFDYFGYNDRWCYHTYEDAKKALGEWDGSEEPKGWHRHPSSGRRVDENGSTVVRW